MFVNSRYWLGHKNLWQINTYMNVQVCFCFCDFLCVSRWCKRSLATPCCIETKLWGLNQLKQEGEQQKHQVQLDLQYKILNYLEGSFFPSHISWKTCFDFFFPFWFRFCQYLLPILFLDCVHDVEVKTPYSPDHLLQYFCLYFFFCCVAQDSSLWLGPCCYGADRIQGLQMLVWCVYWWLYVLIYFQNNLKNIKHSCRDASVCCVHISNIIPCGVFPVTVYDAGVFFSKTFCITFYSTSTKSCIR